MNTKLRRIVSSIHCMIWLFNVFNFQIFIFNKLIWLLWNFKSKPIRIGFLFYFFFSISRLAFKLKTMIGIWAMNQSLNMYVIMKLDAFVWYSKWTNSEEKKNSRTIHSGFETPMYLFIVRCSFGSHTQFWVFAWSTTGDRWTMSHCIASVCHFYLFH